MSYIVLGFIADNARRLRDLPITPLEKESGVHTPLRQDGYYASPDSAMAVAQDWRENRVHPRERVVIVKVVDELPSENRSGINFEDENA